MNVILIRNCDCANQGYFADNPNLPLLRLRNYTIGRKLKDEEVLASDAATRIAHLVGVLTPFVCTPFPYLLVFILRLVSISISICISI